jgi:hypothetical protein
MHTFRYKAEKVTPNLYDLCVYNDETGEEVRHHRGGGIIFIPIQRGDDPVKVIETYAASYTGFSEHKEGFLSIVNQIVFDSTPSSSSSD